MLSSAGPSALALPAALFLALVFSVGNDEASSPESAQTSPIITTTEAKAKMAADESLGDAQDGPIDEGRRVGRPQPPPRRFRPLLGPRSCSEALERCRAGLTTPTDDPVDGRAARRAEEAQEAATPAYAFRPMWRI